MVFQEFKENVWKRHLLATNPELSNNEKTREDLTQPTRGEQKERDHLEDHPRTSKWLITLVSCCPLSRVGLVINGRVSWLINGGDPNHLLDGMILQAIYSSSIEDGHRSEQKDKFQKMEQQNKEGNLHGDNAERQRRHSETNELKTKR